MNPIKQVDFEKYLEMFEKDQETIQTPSFICECGNNIEQIGNEHICTSCGLHYGYEYATEYVDYYKNLYKIRRKSIYKRKYYLEKVIRKYNVPNDKMNEFQQYFNKIEETYKKCTFYKKRMISFNYLFKKVFEMMGLKEQINMCKKVGDKKVLKKYDEVWGRIWELNGWAS